MTSAAGFILHSRLLGMISALFLLLLPLCAEEVEEFPVHCTDLHQEVGPNIVDSWPTWSPDGRKIAFISNRDDESEPVYTGYGRLWIMNADGTKPVRLTDELIYSEPCWSPDGRKIACNAGMHIVIIDVGTREQKDFTRGDRVGFMPNWSPDGSKIAFSAKRTGGDMDIHVSEIGREQEIGGQPRLVARKGADWAPVYSPDGSRIAFRGEEDASDSDVHSVYMVNADGTGLTGIYSPESRIWRVSWLPNGEEVIVDGGIIINVPTRATRKIPRDGGPNGTPAYMYISEPHVSPDGTKLAFTSYDAAGKFPSPADSGSYIWVVNMDGTGLSCLYQVAAPVFEPDGGEYDESQTVTISSATPGATIRYTTDGSDPIESSPKYTKPVRIGKTTTLKAKAWKKDRFPSVVSSAGYVIE